MKSSLTTVKIVLIISIFVSVGTAIGTTAYLVFLKKPTPPIVVVAQPAAEPTITPISESKITLTPEMTITPSPIETNDNKCINGTFTNIAGGYSFECFPEWKFAIAKTNDPKTDSLFGPNATETAGTGGVEVRDNYESIDDYLNSLPDITFTKKKKITINGVVGLRTHYEGFPQKGEAVILFNNDEIFNIYIGTNKENELSMGDINFFNRIVNSFKFINK